MIYKIDTVDSDDKICQLEKLAKEIWNQHFVPIIGQDQVDYMLNKFQCFESIKTQISEGMNYFILKYDNENIGYCGFKKDKNKVFLSKLYIKKNFRGNGYSKILLNRVINFAKENDLGSIYLTVNKYNSNTISIYKHLRFEIIDSVETDIGNSFIMDDYIMELKLMG